MISGFRLLTCSISKDFKPPRLAIFSFAITSSKPGIAESFAIPTILSAIPHDFNVSTTIKSHTSLLYKKLNVNNAQSAIKRAMELKLL